MYVCIFYLCVYFFNVYMCMCATLPLSKSFLFVLCNKGAKNQANSPHYKVKKYKMAHPQDKENAPDWNGVICEFVDKA